MFTLHKNIFKVKKVVPYLKKSAHSWS